ncbi:MAG: hypothetical protein R8N23_09315 [Reichenbachiella sp.]|uniref:LVIVD repeat-containing protein n=1 Tax=Reichenbachiella sp. TaxID=2184521 RepID=UPI0029662A67|nr:hypothetical protein [Reichenbachiella sp.]MDW3210055.1 hypothetical protein [Reichenbachiella sp.]
MKPSYIPTKSLKAISKLIASGILYLLMLSILGSCEDSSCDTEMITYYEPVFAAKSEVIKDAEFEEPQQINNPGKIYYKDEYLFINEVDKGIHVIDNRDRSNPKTVGFVTLPGNKDLAAKGDFLYADNYTDLVVLDISNKTNIVEVNRIENVFDAYYYYTEEAGMLISYTEVQEEVEIDCGKEDWRYYTDDMLFSSAESNLASSSGAGIGGSLARFTITDNYLYTVNEYRLKLFDITITDSPIEGNTVDLGWGIETIFPYEDKLFFGARSGMHIYDNSNPAEPSYISTYEHINTCDPVVVQNDLAYVTLRSGTECETFTNQLDVIDISNVNNPELVVTHEMENPHGLGVKGNCLFIAEGDYGLKVFNASDPLKIGERLTAHHKEVHALDVIPLDDVLFMIGKDGLHQYNYDCNNQFDYLSTISF